MKTPKTSQSATSNIAAFWLALGTSAKLFGILNISWWIITFPLWFSALVVALAIVVLAIIFGFDNDNYGKSP